MKHRKLRIAFSATCGIICLLLILLWVRSYWWQDSLSRSATSRGLLVFSSSRGTLMLLECPPLGYPAATLGWHLGSYRQEPSEQSGERSEDGWPWPFTWHFNQISGQFIIRAPHWLFVTASGILAVVTPWLPWRFSLRTLLIAMTLVAVVLGLIVASN
jgi:hypothetical protein